uniref:Odorant receptor n=1 Tax=Ceracris kiangsu TaxID=227354 RepID=A0A6M6DQI2_CERKI|nr:odorant receptor 47 [Ceracris kiangsu]
MERYQRKEMIKTLSWRESGKSVLHLNIRHLWFFGVWTLGQCPGFKVYTGFAIAMGVWSVVECALAVYFTWGQLGETTLVLIFTSTCGCGIVKTLFFVRDEQRYRLMVQQVANLLALQNEAICKDPALAAILQDSRRRVFRLTLGMLLFMFSQCFIWFPIPLVVYAGERRLPFPQHAWDNNSNYYALSYTQQCVSALYMAQISFGLDCLFASIMILVAAQLKILSGRILKLKKEVVPAEESESALQKHQMAVDKDHSKIYERLCFCINSHQKILRFVADLQDTMSPIAMTQFATSVVILCMALFQATYGEDMSASVKCASYLPIPGGQVYLYCWAADSLSENGESVSTAAYNCPWVDRNARFKHTMRTLMVRAQKPLVLTAGGLYPINREAFLTMKIGMATLHAIGELYSQPSADITA